jgi:hypothetical protein
MSDWDLGDTEFAAKRARQTWWAGGTTAAVLVVVPAVVGVVTHSVNAWFITLVLVVGVGMILMLPLAARQAYREASRKRRPDPVREPPARLMRAQTKLLKAVLGVTIAVGVVQVIVLLLTHL